MKVFHVIPLFMVLAINAQTVAFKNFGDIQMHNDASIGFHTDVINDGKFDDNEGFAGFYSDNEVRVISGQNRPVFEDVEIDAINNLQLNTSLGVTNELAFVNGKVITPRDIVPTSLDFIRHDFYVGEDDSRHIDGYTSVTSNKEFVFPIGDDDRLRPMITPVQNQEVYFNGAYFYENPNTPTTFSELFSTDEKQVFIKNISNYEFWDLDGATETIVTLTWDLQSDIENISSVLDFLRVVGWSKAEDRWVNLGNINTEGDTSNGRITSDRFVPDQYEIITIGSIFSDIELSGGENYLVSPDGNDKNESLVFNGLDLFEKNQLIIFNRWGNVVHEVDNYENNWQGVSTGRATLGSDNKLPTGTYFYILKFGNEKLDREVKGWVYIN
ncbi:gliding motility-associated C-terminal domain-containing protein [Tenacibaculum agarivorans]|uniref:gliding motility-associated C-terminal domain-containing protein n=1 Tax=Tenacibaculum agarivorans TaxID=1908389 RepID=UPI00094BBB51|nr:gliding motility-associated C-terminal domain-containing protein [Tenacibaculum agarivorans]